jgi:2-polyprenyl-3-methyl-5-hydroxy-6-metoxy-1,4-benzoquinol methylase
MELITPGSLDWSRTSQDYAAYRPGYTDTHFDLLADLGVGLSGQHILDLGCGTGALSLPFARRGALVTAVDLAAGQVAAAQARARLDGLDIHFEVGAVEEFAETLGEATFDCVTASMCWGYFDRVRLVPYLYRLLKAEGLLMISSTSWIDDGDNVIAQATNELLARHNPLYAKRGSHAQCVPQPEWAQGLFRLRTWHRYIVNHLFTQEAWRGRLRASKWVGAGLPEVRLQAFDAELAALLARIAPAEFYIPHQVRVEIFDLSPGNC